MVGKPDSSRSLLSKKWINLWLAYLHNWQKQNLYWFSHTYNKSNVLWIQVWFDKHRDHMNGGIDNKRFFSASSTPKSENQSTPLLLEIRVIPSWMEIWQISVTQIESEELRMLVRRVQPLKYGYYRYHPTNVSLSRTTHRLFLTRVLNRETEHREWWPSNRIFASELAIGTRYRRTGCISNTIGGKMLPNCRIM